MYLRHTFLGAAMFLLATVHALPSRRTPSTLDEVKIEIQLRSTVLTQHGTLPSPLKLVRVDEPSNDEAVQVYDVEDLRVSFGEGQHAVVARTMKDPHQKISVDPELESQLVAYGYDGDRRYWLLHVRPFIPRILDDLPAYPLTLFWKEDPDSDAWTSRDMKLRAIGKPEGGYYQTSTTVDWAEDGEDVDVDVVSKRDGSGMDGEDWKRILGDGELVAYGYEAATEIYPKRWWLVGKNLAANTKTEDAEPIDEDSKIDKDLTIDKDSTIDQDVTIDRDTTL